LSRRVIDASVAVKWYVAEEWSEAALGLYGPGTELLAPDLLFPEVGSVLWKKVRRDQLEEEQAFAILGAVVRSQVEIHPCGPLIEFALAIANETGASVCDCTYVSLAAVTGSPLVTADRRLFDRLGATRFRGHTRWIEDAI
jgi:predicted nucleic acid-binding protein